jgi:hypothetical protein
MREKNLLHKIGGFFVAAALLIGVVMMSSTPVQARRGFHRIGGLHSRIFSGPTFGYYSYFGDPYAPYSPDDFDSSEDANSKGYHDGLKIGASDARRGQGYGPERSHHFKDAGSGAFGESYRDGFTRGYEDGFRR